VIEPAARASCGKNRDGACGAAPADRFSSGRILPALTLTACRSEK